ncbi:MAG: plasmid mobilization protein [Bacteroidales bacterium]
MYLSVTEEEQNQIRGKAEDLGVKQSEYLYSLLKNREVKVFQPLYVQELRAVASVANNLNQIATIANKTQSLHPNTIAELKETIQLIHKLISKI